MNVNNKVKRVDLNVIVYVKVVVDCNDLDFNNNEVN